MKGGGEGGIISVIISIDADSEKMEPRCQQAEDATSAASAHHFNPCQEYNTGCKDLPSSW